MNDKEHDRASEAEDVNLISDEGLRALTEVENGFRQFDAGMDELEKWIADSNYKLKPSVIMSLNRIALDRVHPSPGTFRPGKISIRGSGHIPPDPGMVAEYVEDFCDYINDNWDRKTPIHLASYAMWRLNWIHPFSDGNGRTSRIVSYLILCAKLGNRLPGENSIPEQIVANKKPYYDALEHADKKSTKSIVDVSKMEQLLRSYFAKQLTDLHDAAIGGSFESSDEATGVSGDPVTEETQGLVEAIESHPVISTFVGGVLVALIVWLLG